VRLNRVLGIAAIVVFATSCAQFQSVEEEVDPSRGLTATQADRQRAQNERLAACTREIGGWSEDEVWADPVHVGVTMWAPNKEMMDIMDEALDYCLIDDPWIPLSDEPVTIAQAESFYMALMDSKQCLLDLGYPVSEPPSRQVIVDEVMTAWGSTWDPWIEILEWQDPQHSFLAANAACPRPSIWEFVG